MRSGLTTWLLICSAVVLLIAVGRLDLLAIIAPISYAVSMLATHASSPKESPRKI